MVAVPAQKHSAPSGHLESYTESNVMGSWSAQQLNTVFFCWYFMITVSGPGMQLSQVPVFLPEQPAPIINRIPRANNKFVFIFPILYSIDRDYVPAVACRVRSVCGYRSRSLLCFSLRIFATDPFPPATALRTQINTDCCILCENLWLSSQSKLDTLNFFPLLVKLLPFSFIVVSCIFSLLNSLSI